MEFKPVKAEDKETIGKYLAEVNARDCDMTFAAIYLWKDFYKVEYALCEDMLVFLSMEEKTTFSFPIGGGDPGKVINKLKAYCASLQIPLVFHGISRKNEAYLNENFPEYEIVFDRDVADYVYETQALIELKGKKYHGKKNHINKFKRTYHWGYEKITAENTDECLSMLDVWKKDNCELEDVEKYAEICMCRRALLEREFLGLKGGLIRADGKVVAFSLGEELLPDTFCVHVEKALTDIPGAYSIINQEFLIHEASDYMYVNREDDVGDPGLRKAKLSYHPVFFVEKGMAYEIEKGSRWTNS